MSDPPLGQGAPRILHRIDPRLVHATLLEAWVPHIEPQLLMVADRETSDDPRRRTIVQMAARDLPDVQVVPEEAVAARLAALEPEDAAIVVYPSLEAFTAALDGGLSCPRVHIGHLSAEEGRRRVHPSVYVGAPELEAVETLRARGVEVLVQPLPTDPPLGLRRGDDERPVLTEDIVPTPDPPRPPAPEAPSALGGVTEPPPGDPVVPAGAPATRQRGTVRVVNERGLHLRAAHLLAQHAGRFRASVEIGSAGRMVNAKSLLGITTLGAGPGTELELATEGPDAQEAFGAIESLFADGFEEGSA